MGARKVIKIGNSFGITLPSKELRKQEISIGDIIKFKIKKVKI